MGLHRDALYFPAKLVVLSQARFLAFKAVGELDQWADNAPKLVQGRCSAAVVAPRPATDLETVLGDAGGVAGGLSMLRASERSQLLDLAGARLRIVAQRTPLGLPRMFPRRLCAVSMRLWCRSRAVFPFARHLSAARAPLGRRLLESGTCTARGWHVSGMWAAGERRRSACERHGKGT